MSQVNFRLSADENEILKALAEEAGVSVAEYSKRTVKEKLLTKRVDLAFKRLSEGKIHKKGAWLLSGLSYSEFMIEWAKRCAEDIIPDELSDKGLVFALSLDSKTFQKSSK